MKKIMRSTWQNAMNLPLPLPLGEVSAKLTEREYTPSGTLCHLPHRGRKGAFTLAEVKDLPAPDGEGVRRTEGVISKKAAFTLAEVLITLGVIGVVAAMTLPTLFANITERINSERQANIAQKVTQATEQMRAHGLLNTKYASTDAFVDELQKYLKITKRCDSEHIADCWPTPKVTIEGGTEYDVSKAKTRHDLIIGGAGENTNNVGLVLADGSSIILTYDTSTNGIDVGDSVKTSNKNLPVGFGKSKEFPYTTTSTASIDFVMDVNGKKGLNSETIDNKYNDIRSFKIAKFSKGCVGIKISGVGCVQMLDSFNCEEGPSFSCDYWLGAKNTCSRIGMTLPSKSQLESIYNKRNDYSELPKSGGYWYSPASTNWYAYYINFDDDKEIRGYRNWGDIGALCIH